ncbi:hypothetical protein ACTFIZ_002253 [Dictyostelium cf. discoideum]
MIDIADITFQEIAHVVFTLSEPIDDKTALSFFSGTRYPLNSTFKLLTQVSSIFKRSLAQLLYDYLNVYIVTTNEHDDDDCFNIVVAKFCGVIGEVEVKMMVMKLRLLIIESSYLW